MEVNNIVEYLGVEPKQYWGVVWLGKTSHLKPKLIIQSYRIH